MSRYKRLFTVLIMGFGTQSAMAQTLAASESGLMLLYENEEVVEIATGTAKPLHLAPSVASVITAKDIKAMGWHTLDEALESVPGLHVSRSSNRLNSLISMRGIHTDMNAQIVLMINGMPIKEQINGYRAVRFTLPVENIARIEVVRGPGSAIYGADAFAGVINIVTKDASEIDGANVGARAGSFGTRDAWAQYGGHLSNWDVALSLEYSHSDGDRDRIVRSDFQTILDGGSGGASLTPGPLETRYKLFNTSLTANHGHWNIWFNNWNLKDAGVGAGAAEALDPVGSSDVNLYSVLLGYSNKDFGKYSELDARVSYRDTTERNRYQILPPAAAAPIGADGNLCLPPICTVPAGVVMFPDGYLGNPSGLSKEIRSELAITYKRFIGQRIRTAIGFEHFTTDTEETKNFGPGVLTSPLPASRDGTVVDVTGTANIFMPDVTRTVRYLSLQDEWQFAPDWELTAGVRYDDYSDFGSTTNPRLALVWATDYNLTSKLLYGRAFRAPTFGELYYKNNPVLTGNRSLSPETVDMLELAFDYRPTFDWTTTLGVFGYRSTDMIEYVSGTAQNTGKYKGKGAEAEAIWKPGNIWQIKANIALQYAENVNNGQVVANAPRSQAYLAGVWQPVSAWSVSTQAKWVGNRPRAAADSRAAIADYALVDLAIRYQPTRAGWEIAASLRNVFDKDAREPSNGVIPDDYPLEGRAVYLEGRLHVD